MSEDFPKLRQKIDEMFKTDSAKISKNLETWIETEKPVPTNV